MTLFGHFDGPDKGSNALFPNGRGGAERLPAQVLSGSFIRPGGIIAQPDSGVQSGQSHRESVGVSNEGS